MIGDHRKFFAALLLLGAVICPKNAEALDCPMVPPASWYHAVDGSGIPLEKQRHDAEARAALEILDRTPIVFRGRVVSARYLSDLRKTNTPVSLIVFDRVEMLKGRLFTASTDRKAFMIDNGWCDGSCSGRTTEMSWPRGKTVIVAARPNKYVDPSKAMEFSSKRIIYKGRIDVVLGACDSGSLTPQALELLNAPNDEIARLKREYVPRRPSP